MEETQCSICVLIFLILRSSLRATSVISGPKDRDVKQENARQKKAH